MRKYSPHLILCLLCLTVTNQGKAFQVAKSDSLLQIAIQDNDVEAVNKLLSDGANPNMKFNSGLKPTPLMYASAFADGKILDELLKKKVRLDEIDINGDPAINWATYYGHVSNMQKLIKAGAKLNVRSKHGDALDVAFRLWYADSVINVFRGTSLEESKSRDVKRLMKAIRAENYARVSSLLDKEIDPNAKDGLGMSALHHAVRINNKDLVNLLLEKGTNPNIFNRVGQTPLTIAARFGYQEVADILINNGADVNLAGEEYGLSPLIGAAVGGDSNMVMKLVEKGASVDQKDVVNQCAALHWAIFYNNTNIATYLIDKGSDYSAPCLDGSLTAYSLAKSYENQTLSSYIEKRRLNNNPLVGSWTLETIDYIYSDTTYTVDVHQGSLLVGESRYSIMYNPTPQARTPFINLSKPTEDEIIAGFRSIVFNSGWYELIDNVMVAVPDITKVPGFEGGKQFYRFQMQAEKLTFRMFDETYPDGEKPEWFGKLEIEFIFRKE